MLASDRLLYDLFPDEKTIASSPFTQELPSSPASTDARVTSWSKSVFLFFFNLFFLVMEVIIVSFLWFI